MNPESTLSRTLVAIALSLAGSLCAANAQTTLSGDHIVEGDLTVGTTGTNQALTVNGRFELNAPGGGIKIEAQDGGIKLLSPGRETLIFIDDNGNFESQYNETYAPFYARATGRIGSNYLANTGMDGIDLANRQLIGDDGTTVRLEWSGTNGISVNGDAVFFGKVTMPPQGDILMGEFGDTP
jgi:hypothetical protein